MTDNVIVERSLELAWPMTPLALGVVAAAATLAVGVLYALEQAGTTSGLRVTLALLRLGALACLGWLALAPSRVERRVMRDAIVVLTDVSASMKTRDAEGGSRNVAWQRLFGGGAQPLFFNLAERYRVQWRNFAAELGPVREIAAGDAATIRPAPEEAQAEGTRLGDAIRGVVAPTAGGQSPQAVVVVSDGVVTAGIPLAEAAEIARRQGVPLYTIAVGSEAPPQRVALTALIAQQVVFPGDRTAVDAVLRATGEAVGRVRIRLEDVTAGTVLAERDMVLPQGLPEGLPEGLPLEGGQATERFFVNLNAPGTHRLRATASFPVGVAGEDPSGSETSVETSVEVRGEPLTVLLAASTPSYEFRAVKSLLERDPALRLRVALQDADPEYPLVDPTAVAGFPHSLEGLLAYDAIILDNVDTELLPRDTWAQLEAYVAEHAGGLLIVGGSAFAAARGDEATAWQTLLPVEFSTFGTGGSTGDGTRWSVRPTPVGSASALLRLEIDPERNRDLWSVLPPLGGVRRDVEVKPGAEVLAVGTPFALWGSVSPEGLVAPDVPIAPELVVAPGEPIAPGGVIAPETLVAPDEPIAPEGSGGRFGAELGTGLGSVSRPLIVRHFVGAGEVLLHVTDETWRWRWRNDDRYFARYWGQAIRQLGRGRLERGGPQLTVNRESYRPGEPIVVRLRYLGESPARQSSEPYVEVVGAAHPTQRVKLWRRDGFADVYETILRDLPPDRYELRFAAEQGGVLPRYPPRGLRKRTRVMGW
jgi:hypothetical protein